MNGLEAPVTTAPDISTTTPQVAAAMPIATTGATQSPTNSGGGGGNSLKEIFSSMNWVEVIFGILGTAALLSLIQYYNYNLKMNKGFKTEIQNKVDELNIKVADISSVAERDKIIEQGFDGFY